MGETGEQHDRIDLDEAERLVEFEGIRRTRERNEGAAKEGTKSCFKSVAKKKKKEETSARFVNQRISARLADVYRLITSTCDEQERGSTEGRRRNFLSRRKHLEKDLRSFIFLRGGSVQSYPLSRWYATVDVRTRIFSNSWSTRDSVVG